MLDDDFQDEFIAELVNSFYKSLRRCLLTVLKSILTSFASWRPILSLVIESIRDVGGISAAAYLEELLNRLEGDIDEWRRLNQLDPTPMVEAELERLLEEMKNNYLEISKEAEAISEELKILDVREAEISEAIVISSEALEGAKDHLKKAGEMIARAKTIISKVEPVHQAETICLKEKNVESVQIQHIGAKK